MAFFFECEEGVKNLNKNEQVKVSGRNEISAVSAAAETRSGMFLLVCQAYPSSCSGACSFVHQGSSVLPT